MVEVGRVPGTHHFRNRQRFNVERLPGVLFLRVDESLFFGNARQVRLAILRHVAEAPETRRLVLIMSAVNRVDTSAVAMLEQLDDTLAAEGIRFDLAEVKGPVSDVLQRAGVARRFDGRIFLSTQSARAMHRSLSPDYCI
ncbi:sodium-independent anion transporter [Paludibacterium denitrificans]|uniref:sodium-independent anion transporter n=1 Tax=Paludibacterium denitrificans TaxID=2675226 RepID=UPI001E443911|nr:sodium-independent anion transporter [Paludibacterium denitrificans]